MGSGPDNTGSSPLPPEATSLAPPLYHLLLAPPFPSRLLTFTTWCTDSFVICLCLFPLCPLSVSFAFFFAHWVPSLQAHTLSSWSYWVFLLEFARPCLWLFVFQALRINPTYSATDLQPLWEDTQASHFQISGKKHCWLAQNKNHPCLYFGKLDFLINACWYVTRGNSLLSGLLIHTIPFARESFIAMNTLNVYRSSPFWEDYCKPALITQPLNYGI